MGFYWYDKMARLYIGSLSLTNIYFYLLSILQILGSSNSEVKVAVIGQPMIFVAWILIIVSRHYLALTPETI